MAIKTYTHPEVLPASLPRTFVVIGNFDGVHKGHQAILAAAKKQADAQRLPLVALTFDPHPREVLTPKNAPLRLTSLKEKTSLLQRYGAEYVYVIPFSEVYAQTAAEAFIKNTLQLALRAKHVAVGEDFAFGRQRQGDVNLLKAQGLQRDFSVQALALQLQGGGEVYSSTAIRQLIEERAFEKAQELLGHTIKLIEKAQK